MSANIYFIRKLRILFFLTSYFLLLTSFIGCKEKKNPKSSNEIPHIVSVSKNEAVINWDSKQVYEGAVYYKNTAKEVGRRSSGKD